MQDRPGGSDMSEAFVDRIERANTVIDRLSEAYPDATISLEYTSRFELLVAVILSAQCTDARVNQVTETLFQKYDSIEAFATADQDELAEDIGSITYFNSKARYLRESAQVILDEHDRTVPDTMAALTQLPGVGRKTANVVLQHGHDIDEGIVVDTHVQRLSRRLGLTEEERPDAIETDLIEVIPERHWRKYTHLLIAHGRAVCSARNPACDACILSNVCPSSRENHAIDLASGEPWTA